MSDQVDVPASDVRCSTVSIVPEVRAAARVLLFDDADRLLLFRGIDPHVPEVVFWFTPGGGVEVGEDLRSAARRELFEETGCTSAELGPAVWTRSARFSFEGEFVQQLETFFVARVPSWEVDTSGFTELEQRCMLEHRWWTVAELSNTPELMYPKDMPALVADLLRHGPPASPLEVGA